MPKSAYGPWPPLIWSYLYDLRRISGTMHYRAELLKDAQNSTEVHKLHIDQWDKIVAMNENRQ